MKRTAVLFCSSLFFGINFCAIHAGSVMKDTTLGGLHIELHVMPAEPFYSRQEVASQNIPAGMLVIGGAPPVGLTAKSSPDHHLVIHVYDVKSGKAVTDAKVRMSFRSLGNSAGHQTNVPVVIMQEIGRGEQSTHYGNNVTMPNGSYSVAIIINRQKVTFTIALTDSGVPSMGGMNMH